MKSSPEKELTFVAESMRESESGEQEWDTGAYPSGHLAGSRQPGAIHLLKAVQEDKNDRLTITLGSLSI